MNVSRSYVSIFFVIVYTLSYLKYIDANKSNSNCTSNNCNQNNYDYVNSKLSNVVQSVEMFRRPRKHNRMYKKFWIKFKTLANRVQSLEEPGNTIFSV